MKTATIITQVMLAHPASAQPLAEPSPNGLFIATPQFGQVLAWSEILLPHSGQLISDITNQIMNSIIF